MAVTKTKKTNSKVFDIAKPGKSAPTATSKPVIVTHRPVLQDPMVVNIAVTDDELKPLASPSEVRRKVQISPLHDVNGNDIAPGAPELAKAKILKVDDSSDNSLVLDLPPEITGEKPETSIATSAPEVPAEVAELKDSEEQLTTETEAPISTESKIEAKDAKNSEEDQEEATSAVSEATELNSSAATPEEVDDDDTSEFGLIPEPAVGDEGQTNPDAAKQKADEEAQKIAEEQEKIIDNGIYFLPIDAVAHRRAARQTMIGLVLVLLFGALLFLAALDAEMFTINGLPAPTDYL